MGYLKIRSVENPSDPSGRPLAPRRQWTTLTTSISDNVINAIECLTKRGNEAYLHFINRIKKDQLARSVKIEDVKDNMDLKRFNSITDKDLERTTKYHKALNIFLENYSLSRSLAEAPENRLTTLGTYFCSSPA